MYPLPYEPQKLQETKPVLFKRGDVHRIGDELIPGWPEMFGAVTASSGPSGRADLVDWLTSSANPLVARVWVNYIWQQHFGRGLVTTSGDFGLQGTAPTHPELLDWLATELVGQGWRTKQIHKLIVLSSTYRQSAQATGENVQRDPDNTYWWNFSPRRLESEAIRDSVLVVSGELDRTLGGESIATKDEEKHPRRSIYLRQRRHDLPVMQGLFDAPSANESCPRRHTSMVALQPLYLLNSEFMLKRATAFAQRVRNRAGDNLNAQIRLAFEVALGRRPDSAEIDSARFLMEKDSGDFPPKPDSPRALVHFCHALLNLDEFSYVE